MLEPKKGKAGCLSLQYHREKSESWFVFQGIAWALVVVDDVVCTRIMRPGDIQNLERGTIHRLMGVSDDCRVLEPSTPDAYAADKNVVKDVIRLHCMLGREVAKPSNDQEAKVVAESIKITVEACAAIDDGQIPPEINVQKLIGNGAFRI